MSGIPKYMQCVGMNETDGKILIRKVPVPIPGKGEVLVKIAAAPVNPSDMARIKHLPVSERGSFISGVEGCGRVVARGSGLLPKLWMGKRVACSASNNTTGTWAEFVVAGAMSCIPLPDDVSDEQGSMLLVNPLTAVAFFSIIKKGGHKAVINTAAASALGRIIEYLGKENGVPLIHIVRSAAQAKALRARNAAYVLNQEEQGFQEELAALASRLHATLALDAVGGDLTGKLLKAVPMGGTVMVYGNLSGDDPVTDHRSLVADNKRIEGFYLVNWLREQGLMTKLQSVLTARKLLKHHITIPVQARFPLSQAQEGIDAYLSDMTAGKVLLVPGEV